ncbi:hypothetical protein HFO56_03405 [Rhizobium laguerreae]|uniref:hypothetical protein n=1 Tax=Rhizobium laguerreae TaxID=1076926 RepID=UPI001C90B857|nr:hypothetical protein [Rhizobium laguerreae]MBY3151435.1 hypothetical protein [Rhizobium laguerreae]
MSIHARFPFAYKADVVTARGFFDGRLLVDTVNIDVPVMSATDCPVVMTWKTTWNARRPGNSFQAGEGEAMAIRHRDGRYYLPVKPQAEGLDRLTADHLPGRGRHDYGVDGSEALGALYDRHLPGGDDRARALREWLTGKFKRQPVEDDIQTRSKSDYLVRRAEASELASRLAVIDGVLHVEVCEPKFVVNETYFNSRDDVPPGVTSCPLVAIFVGEARFGARLSHFNVRQLDARAESRVVSMREFDALIKEYDRQGTPVLLYFDDLQVSDDLDFQFDGELNRRWRVVAEVVSLFADQVQTMPEAHAVTWMRLRRIAAMRENEVTREAVDDIYEDVVALVSLIDIKDRDRARLLAAKEWWNDAPITFEMGGRAAPSPR